MTTNKALVKYLEANGYNVEQYSSQEDHMDYTPGTSLYEPQSTTHYNGLNAHKGDQQIQLEWLDEGSEVPAQYMEFAEFCNSDGQSNVYNWDEHLATL